MHNKGPGLLAAGNTRAMQMLPLPSVKCPCLAAADEAETQVL